MALDEKLIEQIVEQVVTRLSANDMNAAPDNTPSKSQVQDGVFDDMETCVQAARQAHQQLLNLPLDVRRDVLESIRECGRANAEEYGRLEFEETDLGKLDDNIKKNISACQVMGMEDLTPEIYAGDKGVTIIERIPIGVIASVNPVTNGTPTILFNAIMMLAGGNTVVMNPHPKTKKVSARLIRDLNKAIVAAGGPPNCVCCLADPTVPSAQKLMTHPDIGLLAVTGGHGVMDFASKTGKRLIAGGPGNPPVVVDETADLERAARNIVQGAGFSNCIACASEKEIFVVESVADALKEQLRVHGAHELTADQGKDLLAHIFKEIKPPGEGGVIDMDYIGKTPAFILKSIGIDIGPEIQIVILETDWDHPLVWTEQIMPVLPIVRCRNVDEAIDRAIAAEQNFGHSMAIHSTDLNNIKKMAARARCASFIKNGACGTGGVGVTGEGYVSFHIATNGDGHTRPRTFTQIRRCVMSDDLRYRFGEEN